MRRALLLAALLNGAACSTISEPPAAVGGDWVVKYKLPRTTSGKLGFSVAVLDDVTGDGQQEIVAGAIYSSAAGQPPGSGEVFLFSGDSGSPFRDHGGAWDFAQLGYDLSVIEDLDGDMVQDLIVGAPTTPDALPGQTEAVYVYSGATGSLIFKIDSPEPGTSFGYSVAAPGDVDGNGTPDILVGAPFAHPDSASAFGGKAYVFSGDDASLLWTGQGSGWLAVFGIRVGRTGDVNDDGHADILVGAPASQGNMNTPGRVFVYSGQDGSVLHQFEIPAPSGEFGRGLASGFLDGDTVPDFVVGAPSADVTGAGMPRGHVYAYSGATGNLLWDTPALPIAEGQWGFDLEVIGDGNQDGIDDIAISSPTVDAAIGEQQGIVVVVSGADGHWMHFAAGESAYQRFGRSLAAIGDVDGDGFPETVVGAPNEAGPSSGPNDAVYVYGRDPYLDLTADTISASSGVAVTAELDFDISEAGKKYALLVSGSGSGPTEINTLWIPLTAPDPFLDQMALLQIPPGFQNVLPTAFGTLDGNARATVTIQSHPDLASQVGETFYLAAVSAEPQPTLEPRTSSVVRTLTVVP